MLKSKTYLIFISVLVCIAGFFFLSNKKQTNWEETFLNNDKKPFDTYILYKLLPDLFPKGGVEEKNEKLATFVKNQPSDSVCNVIKISSSLYFDDDDVPAILEFVERGNNLFLATSYISYNFLEELQINYFWENNDLQNEENEKQSFEEKMAKKADYLLTYTEETYALVNNGRFVNTFLYSFDDSSTFVDVLGFKVFENWEEDRDKNNFLMIPRGKGNIFIHSGPHHFSNYTMVKGHTADYAAAVFSVLPDQKTYWLEDQNALLHYQESEMHFVLKNESLRWAWYVLVFGGLFVAILALKRRQQYIPIITPLRNSSLEFVQTVGRLYFQKKNNNDLAHKKAIYFIEKLRAKTGIVFDASHPDIQQIIMNKTGASEEKTHQLLLFLKAALNNSFFDDQNLFEFHQIITYFYQKMNE